MASSAVNDEIAREVLRKDVGMPPQQILVVKNLFTWPISDLGLEIKGGLAQVHSSKKNGLILATHRVFLFSQAQDGFTTVKCA